VVHRSSDDPRRRIGSERDSLAVVLDEPFEEPEPSQAQLELMERLIAAAPDVEINGWAFMQHAVSPAVSELGILIYRSPDRVAE
jgi:hypothetical protein